jgi:hypothetical protein
MKTKGNKVRKRIPMKVGDTVRLRKKYQMSAGGGPDTAKIRSFLRDIKGGVFLDDYLDDFRCWNVLDLAIVKRAKSGNA